jgi:hypothetical protein
MTSNSQSYDQQYNRQQFYIINQGYQYILLFTQQDFLC